MSSRELRQAHKHGVDPMSVPIDLTLLSNSAVDEFGVLGDETVDLGLAIHWQWIHDQPIDAR